MTAEEAAELILRCGGVIGFLGNSRLISNSQELSKDLLTQARQRYLSLLDFEKIAECENYLALAYSRTGEYVEAEDWLNEALTRDLPEYSPTRIYSYVIDSLLNLDKKKYRDIVEKGLALENLFIEYAPPRLNGCFHNHRGIAYKNLGEKNSALKHLKLALKFFDLADHKIYCGATENNLAQLYHREGNYAEAHNCAKRAKKIFEMLGDKPREAFSLETRSQIFIAEGKYTQALKIINEAIERLEGSESYRNLIESYRTKVEILIQLGRLPEALLTMTAAHNLAAIHISQNLAKDIIENTAQTIKQKFVKY